MKDNKAIKYQQHTNTRHEYKHKVNQTSGSGDNAASS